MNKNILTPTKILAKNTLLNLLGMVIPLLVGIAAIPFAVKGLGTDGFGILSIAWIFLGYLGLLDFGISRATTKFAAEVIAQKDNHVLPSIMWTAVIVSFVFGIGGAIVLFLATPYLVGSLLKIPVAFISQTKLSFYFFSGALPLILSSTSLRGMLGAAQRFDLVNAVSIPTNILNFLFPALSLPFGFSLSTVILLIVLTRVGASFFYFFLCLRIFPTVSLKPSMDLKILKKFLSYGGWVTVTSIISPILVYLDRFFIGSLLSMKAVAFYSAPYEALYRLRIIPMAMMTTFFPEFSAIFSYNKDRVSILFGRSMKYILISTGLIALLLFIYAHIVLQLWLGNQFAEKSTTIFKIFAPGIVINSLAYIPFTLFQGIGKPDIPAKFHLMELPVYILLLWFFTKKFGINGAAMVWFLRVALDSSLLYFWAFRSYPNLVHSFRENKILTEIALLFFLWAFLFLSNSFFSSISIKVVFLLVGLSITVLIVWYKIFDNSEKKFITSLIQKVIPHRSVGIL